uniref:Uncharacterized protein n=1 Tax=Percolomonas cosmopolitus TaxID=63605 RepID=A0A7S1KSI7_9EUKA|mmetsp:Transcript_7687/g.28827  ORF Transcript_7687/g.28827 Transcript_7687/m.28827 type:complete len:832 (+) Transcript_7687:3-2498(+)
MTLTAAPISLSAAEKLEHHYEETSKRIKQFESEYQTRQVSQHHSSRGGVTSRAAASSHHGRLMPNDAPQDNSIEFSLGELRLSEELSVDMPQHEDEPVYERLLNFGLNLKMKQESKRKNAQHALSDHHRPSITKTASKINRDGLQVEDLLLKRNVEYQAHIEDLRRIKQKEEMGMLQEPRINKVSHDLVRSEPAYSRLYDIRKQTLAKREMMRHKIREQEMGEVRDTPQINRVSKKMHRGVDAILEWEKERREKAERRKRELEQREMAKCKPRRINATSDRLVRKMNRGSKVEDHLLAEHERKKMEREEKLRMEQERQAMEAVPLISLHSASLPRERDEKIFDRLYNVATQRAANLNAAQQQQNGDDTISNHSRYSSPFQPPQDRDPQTGQKLYHPSINDRSQSLRRALPVEDLLQAKGEERKRKREMLAKQISQEMNEKKTIIGPYSQLLVEILEKRTNTSSQERLHMPIRKRIKQATKKELDTKQRAHTFQPEINPLSRAIDKNNNRGKRDRTALLFKKGKDYQTKKDRLRQQIEAEKLSECTFSPRAASPGGAPSGGSLGASRRRSSPAPSRSASIADRNQEWARRKVERLEEERKEKRKQMMEECTFQPNISKGRSSVSHLGGSRSHTPPPKRPTSAQRSRSRSRRDSQSGQSGRSRTPPPRGGHDSQKNGISKYRRPSVKSNGGEQRNGGDGYFHAQDILKAHDESRRFAQPQVGLREPSELPTESSGTSSGGIRNRRSAARFANSRNGGSSSVEEAESDERASVRQEQERTRQISEISDRSEEHLDGSQFDDLLQDIAIDTTRFSSEASALLRDLLQDFSSSTVG